MPSKIAITGTWQNVDGNPLANGYLLMHITDDAQIPTVGQISSLIKFKVTLDANGSILGTVNIWPNNVLNPATTQYVVQAYSAAGQFVWQKTLPIPNTSNPFNFNV